MTRRVRVRELAAWDLDRSPHRERWAGAHPGAVEKRVATARETMAQRRPWRAESALVTGVPESLFARHAGRADLAREMRGLRWELGAVDLRKVLAFQRRLILDEERKEIRPPASDDWAELVEFGFGPARPVEYRLVREDAGGGFSIRSSNPDLQVALERGGDGLHPLVVHGGSPFFEVAEFRGRWFLRDGYHRAYACLREGVPRMPAVIVRAQTMGELGATQPWFFPEDVLFSERPPAVADFVEDGLCLEYERPATVKTLHVSVEETLSEEEPECASSIEQKSAERVTGAEQ